MPSARHGTGARPGPPSRPPPRERGTQWYRPGSGGPREDGRRSRGRVTAASPGGGAVAAPGGRAARATAVYRSHRTTGLVAQKPGSVCWHWGRPAGQGVDAPAGADRAGPGVGLAERRGIGMPGDARTHLAPHDRHPQLIADHSPPGHLRAGSGLGAGTASARARLGRGLRRGHRPRPGAGVGLAGSGTASGSGAGVGLSLGAGLDLGRILARDRCRARAGRGHRWPARHGHRPGARRASRPSGSQSFSWSMLGSSGRILIFMSGLPLCQW